MIESTENKISYIVGESKVFPFNIRFFRPEDIKCFLNQDNVQTELVRNVDFSIERKANYNNGAKITLLAKKLPVGATLSILRICDITQDLALPENGKLPSAGLEKQLDKLTMIAQQISEEISRSIKVGVSETDADPDALLASIYGAVAAAEESAGAAAGSVTACENIAEQVSGTAQAAAKSAEDSENSAAAAAESARDAEEKVSAALKNVSAALGKLESEMQMKAQPDLGNVTNPTQGFKDMAIGWGMPDYSAGISIPSGYVAPCSGYVVIVRGVGNSKVYLNVDGVQVDSNESNSTNEGGSVKALVGKGSTVTWSTGNITGATFFPLKGAN